MSTSPQHADRTRLIARVLGPFLVIVTLTAVARAAEMGTLLSAFEENPVWPWVTGAFVLAGGLTIIALHQYWRSVAAVIVSVLGWLLVLRGFVLLAFPHEVLSLADAMLAAGAVWRTADIGVAVVGVYLTYVGWFPSHSSAVRIVGTAPDRPRMA